MESNNKITLESLFELFQQSGLQIQETGKRMDQLALEADRRAAEAEKEMAELRKSIKEQGKQIGGLHNSMGEYTENFLKVSIEKLLRDNFNVESYTHDFKFRKADKEIQIDAMGYSNSTKNELYIVELKNKLSDEDIEQLDKIIENYTYFLPEHKDKKVYGLIAAIKYDQRVVNKLLARGYYFAHIADDMLVLDVPKDFVAKSYSKN